MKSDLINKVHKLNFSRVDNNDVTIVEGIANEHDRVIVGYFINGDFYEKYDGVLDNELIRRRISEFRHERDREISVKKLTRFLSNGVSFFVSILVLMLLCPILLLSMVLSLVAPKLHERISNSDFIKRFTF